MFDLIKKILHGETLHVENGNQIAVFQCHRQQVAYLSYDRSTESCFDLLQRFGLSEIPWHSFRNLSKADAVEEEHPLSDLRRIFPSKNLKCVFVDGLGLTIPGKTGDYRATGNYMRYLGKVAEEQDFAIVGTLHTPKQRLSDKILNPRQLALGSSALGGCAETMIYFDHQNPADPTNPRRFAYLIPHNGPAICQWMEFSSSGFLIPSILQEASDNELLEALPQSFTRKEAQSIGADKGMSRAAIDREIRQSLIENKIKRLEKFGSFEKN
jgi:hypothetical protein